MSGFSLDGKRILVTGAGTGIGQAIAIASGCSGAAVVVHYAHSSAGAQAGVAYVMARGGSATAVQADLSVVSECRRLVRHAVDLLGGLDGLVNNAAVTQRVAFLDTDEYTYDSLVALNMRGYFFCAQEAVKVFIGHGGGVILNITSGQALVGIEGHAAYASTKGAIVSFTRELAIELAPLGIRVNAIGPGLIEVPRIVTAPPSSSSPTGYDRARAAASIPLGRVGDPKDVAIAAAFLLSDSADYITGQVLYVDGGITAQVPAAL